MFFKVLFSKTIFSNTIRESNSMDPDQDPCFDGLGLIWVQSVCKGYQQMTLVGKTSTFLWNTKGQNQDKICLEETLDITAHFA